MFWVPRRPSSLREAIKRKEIVVQLAHLQIPCVLAAFNPTSFKKWLEEKKMIESEADLKHFCRDKVLVTWFEMKSRGWDRELKFPSKRHPF